jgi:hypothetical protein
MKAARPMNNDKKRLAAAHDDPLIYGGYLASLCFSSVTLSWRFDEIEHGCKFHRLALQM